MPIKGLVQSDDINTQCANMLLNEQGVSLTIGILDNWT